MIMFELKHTCVNCSGKCSASKPTKARICQKVSSEFISQDQVNQLFLVLCGSSVLNCAIDLLFTSPLFLILLTKGHEPTK